MSADDGRKEKNDSTQENVLKYDPKDPGAFCSRFIFTTLKAQLHHSTLQKEFELNFKSYLIGFDKGHVEHGRNGSTQVAKLLAE